METAAIESPIGTVEITVDDGALTTLEFVTASDAPPTDSAGVSSALRAYFDGDVHALDPVRVRFDRGTPFQHDVWNALRTIPVGETISYAELAERVGRPGAFRAVGSANGRNPVSLVVPCHRVINTGGGLGGYGGGLDRKEWLLAHESLASPAPRLAL